MIARPTATSAAATVRMKKTKTLPSIVPLKREKATRARVEATSISSRHMKMTSVLRRRRTPRNPRAKRSELMRDVGVEGVVEHAAGLALVLRASG